MWWEPTDLTEYTQFFSSVRIFTSGTKCQLKFSQKFQVLWDFFTKSIQQLYCHGCATPASLSARQRGEREPSHTPQQALEFCVTDPEAAISAQDRTPQLHLAPQNCNPGTFAKTCLLTKTQWLTLLNLVDVGRKDLTLKGAALYSTMRPRHRAFYKTLPFRENVAGNPKKYG